MTAVIECTTLFCLLLLHIKQVNDMRDTIFKSRQYGNIFPGTGHHLGGKKAPSRLLPSTKQARDGGHYKETSDRPTLPVGTFLSRLPQSVVRKGKIIDVRNGVQNALQVSRQDCLYIWWNSSLGMY